VTICDLCHHEGKEPSAETVGTLAFDVAFRFHEEERDPDGKRETPPNDLFKERGNVEGEGEVHVCKRHFLALRKPALLAETFRRLWAGK
jgi:hypothetical protein